MKLIKKQNSKKSILQKKSEAGAFVNNENSEYAKIQLFTKIQMIP